MPRPISPITLCSLLLALCLSACGDGGEPAACGAGNDDVPSLFEEADYSEVHRFASIGIEESYRIGGSDPGHDTLIQAGFIDTTNYRVQDAPRVDYLPAYPACVVYTGQPVKDGEPVPLRVEEVNITGLAADLVLEPDPLSNQFSPKFQQGRAFGVGRVTVQVVSAGGADSFPAFTEEIDAPQAPELTEINGESPVALAEGPSVGITTDRMEPLRLGWKAGNGQSIEFLLIPGAGSETPFQKLRCVTYDDGCLEIPAEALALLALDEATNFRLKLERHIRVPVLFKDGEVVNAVAVIDVSSLVEGVVRR